MTDPESTGLNIKESVVAPRKVKPVCRRRKDGCGTLFPELNSRQLPSCASLHFCSFLLLPDLYSLIPPVPDCAYTSQLGDLCSHALEWDERGTWPTPTWSSSYFRMNSWNTARLFIPSDLLMVKTRLQNIYLPKDWFWGCQRTPPPQNEIDKQLNIFLRRKDLNWYFTKEMGIYGCP